MKILWIVQKDLRYDLDSATWLEPSKIMNEKDCQVILIYAAKNDGVNKNIFLQNNARRIKIIHRFPFIALSFHIQIFIRSFFWVLREKPDIVMMHPITALAVLPAHALTKIFRMNCKFILDVRTLPVGSFGLRGKIKRQLTSLSIFAAKFMFNGITVITPALKRMFVERFKIHEHKIGVWQSGVDADLFHPRNQTDLAEKKNFTILYHGVIAENRGILETVQAMEIVSGKNRHVKLVIIGNGLGRDNVEKLIRERKLQSCVELLSPVPQEEIPNFIQAADCGIIPLPDYKFWRISSPLKLFEYLAMSKPVILSRIEAHVSVLNDRPAGIYLESVSPEAIADAINSAYQHRHKMKEWGDSGRRLVMENYTWHNQTEQLIRYLSELTA